MDRRKKVSDKAQEILDRLTPEQIETLVGCSSFGQFIDGLRNYLSTDCPCAFCTIDREEHTVLYETRGKNGWIAWEVPMRYTTRKSTLAHQIVFFPKRHVRNPWEFTKYEKAGYFDVLWWAQTDFNLPGGAVVNRFGDMRYNVGTILHMHATILVPNRKGRVIVPLQKSVGMHRTHTNRMYAFLERYVEGERA